ncbi:S1C family serine protease [Mesoterricola sediminis]|uniref:2-alkenal reductase n=1 Tax=Mesoterricola sediminis TaxID=2927980 RepID=A0AA48GVG4_9BACT|nr:trypsin-like peptidase domain-containing protein [Mesoterricola sediminis]BDU78549.1 2-alkenal reductase [Mesoterricola sediminis]
MADRGTGFRRVAIALALVLPLAAQEGFEHPRTQLSPKEQETVDYNRRLARPRTPLPRLPLTAEEKARARSFNQARNSVVFIHSITDGYYTSNRGDVYAIPPASGTGFVWDSLGHVVTNHHVISYEDPAGRPGGEADNLQVTLADGRVYKAVVIGRNLAQDIAVLHVFAPLDAMKPLPIGTSKDLVVGQDVLAIGNPFGLDHTLTTGIISALGRDIPTSFGTHITGAIQTDAAINPGNSGGPLLDRAGRLIGMNTAITTNSGASAGVGLAIPVDTLNKVVPILIARGQTYRPVLGFSALPSYQNPVLNIGRGVAVFEVTPGGIADKAGLRGFTYKEGSKAPYAPEDVIVGDVILTVNGLTLSSDAHLMDFLDLTPPEQTLDFEVLRAGKVIHITLKPEAAAPVAERRT